MTKCFLTSVFIQAILALFAIHASAEDFFVINNEANGTGSFEWALNQARFNGDQPDRIIFAIPRTGEEDRTITVTSQFATLSSNLTIDASLQAGSVFGVTDAKIRIVTSFGAGAGGMLYGNGLHDIAIYGISIVPISYVTGAYAISLTRCKNVIIGAPGKGNHFGGLGLQISSSATDFNTNAVSENVKVSSNIMGMSDDGESPLPVYTVFQYVKNLTFGGASAAEGNRVYGPLVFIDDEFSDLTPAGKIYVANNRIGSNFSGTRALQFNGQRQEFAFQLPYTDGLEIVENQICGDTHMHISGLSRPFKISRNKFGTDATGTKVLGMWDYALKIENIFGGGMIGGPDATDGNIISGTYSQQIDFEGRRSSIVNNSSPRIEIVNNVFRCNNVTRPYDNKRPNDRPIVSSKDVTGIRGKAQPNSRIDLYYSLSCTFCEPEQFFASVLTNANGDWSYAGAVQDLTVIAAATLNGQTSEFSSAFFDYDRMDIHIKPSCNETKGSITGMNFVNGISLGWYDEADALVSNDLDLIAGPGKYRFRIGNAKCELNSPFYEIPSETVYVNNVQSIPQSCSKKNGRIEIESNAVRFEWYDQNNQIVGSTRNLTGMEAGSYTLLAGIGECSQAFGPFAIQDLGGTITLDDGSASAHPSSCQKANGSITSILVTGATKYEWFGQNGQLYRETPTADLSDAVSGKYKLRASNATCFEWSDEITITEPAPVSFAGITFTMSLPCADKKGSIKVDLSSVASQITALEWRDATDEPKGSAATLSGLEAGTYLLYLVDVNGCRNPFKSFDLNKTVPMTIDESRLAKNKDHCGYGKGSITGLSIGGGFGSRKYTWRNLNGEVVGAALDLTDVRQGSYMLQVSDDSQCGAVAGPFILGNDEEQISAPVLTDISICSAGEVVIAVQQSVQGTYNIYHEVLDAVPFAQNSTGVFNVMAGNETAFYVSLSKGTCESMRTKVVVKVEDSNLKIINAFSPNGDGKNDLWIISGLESYPKCQISVYNRAGTAVYRSTGNQTPFDGKSKGADLPVGVYYYVIYLRQGCREISGSLTLVR